MEDNFNDFDGNSFDPSNFADEFAPLRPATVGNKPIGSGVTMITLRAANAQATTAIAQFFGIGTGIAAGIIDTAVTSLTPLAGPPLAAAGNATNASRFYFDTTGKLQFQDAANALLTLSCDEVSYRSLLMGTIFGALRIKAVRMNCNTEAQISQIITFKELTMFGKTGYRDSINPRQYFSPNQFQTKIVDIPYNWTFNQERVFEQPILAAENVTYALSITDVVKCRS